jgi:hypothetical protein
MRRRAFIAGLGGTVAALGQPATPVIVEELDQTIQPQSKNRY